jgi:hypothetical protein
LVGAPGVNAPEDGNVTGGDRRAPAEMLAADVYKVGIIGEGYGEGRAIHRVPGCLELANDALECGSIGEWQVSRHRSPRVRGPTY